MSSLEGASYATPTGTAARPAQSTRVPSCACNESWTGHVGDMKRAGSETRILIARCGDHGKGRVHLIVLLELTEEAKVRHGDATARLNVFNSLCNGHATRRNEMCGDDTARA